MRAAPLIALACAACAGGYGGGGRPAAAPAPAPANAVTYAPGVTRYRSASHQHVERRLGSQDQSNDAALVAYVSATVATGGAGLQVTFTVDSVPTYVTGLPVATAADAPPRAPLPGTPRRAAPTAAPRTVRRAGNRSCRGIDVRRLLCHRASMSAFPRLPRRSTAQGRPLARIC